jgi:hypothetical protein
MPTDRQLVKVFSSLLVGALLFGCASASIRDYKSKSSQEEAIRTALIAFETAWNTHEEKAVLAFLDDDFVLWVWTNGRRKIVFSKGTFGFRLQDILIRWRYLSLGLPEIWIRGSEATVHVPVSVDGSGSRITFRLVNRDRKWLFLEWEFYLNPI